MILDQIPDFYKKYTVLFSDHTNAWAWLRKNALYHFIKQLSEEKLNTPYSQGKWTPVQVVRHVNDSERVLQFRALWIARGSSEPQPGFDQDLWAKNYPLSIDKSLLEKLLQELLIIRQSSILLFESFTEKDLLKTGVANNILLSVGVLMYVIAGHEKHHYMLLKKYC